MNISIHQHNAVVRGLAAEICILRQQLKERGAKIEDVMALRKELELLNERVIDEQERQLADRDEQITVLRQKLSAKRAGVEPKKGKH